MKIYITLQRSNGYNYMWAYTAKKDNKIVSSGGIYYSRTESILEVKELIKREIKTCNDEIEFIVL